MTTRHLYILLILLAFTACSDEEGGDATNQRTNGYSRDLNNRQDSLFDDVMEGHDVGMAKMGKLIGARKAISFRMDSLAKTAKAADKKRAAELANLSAALQAAETDMNEWMENFNVDSATENETARVAYLESERNKVFKVRDSILSVIKRADSALTP